MPDREALRERIARRVDAMLAEGWLDEVRTLLASGVQRTMPSMRAIGYAELADVAERKLALADARQRIVDQTRQYAKRQMTWMKRYQKQ
jgi:tRNA dimethylallyltransferase